MIVIVWIAAGTILMLTGTAIAFVIDQRAGWSRIPFGNDGDPSRFADERAIPRELRRDLRALGWRKRR